MKNILFAFILGLSLPIIAIAVYCKNIVYFKIGVNAIKQTKKYGKSSIANYTIPLVDLSMNEVEKKSSKAVPISDILARAYIDAFNTHQQVFTNLIKVESNTGLNESSDTITKEPWVFVHTNDMQGYIGLLQTKPREDSVIGFRIYTGLIDTNQKVIKTLFAKSIDSVKDYFRAKQGTMIPIIYAVRLRKNKDQEYSQEIYPSIFPVDCNCGNPPTCKGGNASVECTYEEMDQGRTCTKCPRKELLK